MQIPELVQPGDMSLMEEDDLADLGRNGGFDIMIGDPALRRIVERDFTGIWADLPQFPVSGKLVGV